MYYKMHKTKTILVRPKTRNLFRRKKLAKELTK